MTAHTAIEPPSFYGMFRQERDYTCKLEGLLDRSVSLLSMETDRRERAGEDVSHLRSFISEARAAA